MIEQLELRARLDVVIPDDWTYEVKTQLSSGVITVTILSAPVDLLAPYREQFMRQQGREPTFWYINHYQPENEYSGETLDVFKKIIGVLKEVRGGYIHFRTSIQIRVGSIEHPFQYIQKCVHTEHCCIDHGCKYGDADCPVCLGLKPQSFQCEQCLDDENEEAHFKAKYESVFKDAERYRVLRECTDPVIWGELMSVMPFATEAFDRIIDEYKLRTKK